jgi:hypothetical protein
MADIKQVRPDSQAADDGKWLDKSATFARFHLLQRSDSHTRTTFVRDASYGERVSRSCGGIIFGWILVAAAGFLLYWYMNQHQVMLIGYNSSGCGDVILCAEATGQQRSSRRLHNMQE